MNKYCLLDLISPLSQIILKNGEKVNTINLDFKTVNELRTAFKNFSYVYAWYNSETKMIYVGSSIDMWRRFLSYKNSFWGPSKGKNNIRLIKDFKKHGEKSIKLCILEIVNKNKKQLKDREQFYLDSLAPFRENGYNLSTSADRPLNCKLSKQGRKKIAERHTGENSEVCKLSNEKVLKIKQQLFYGLSLNKISKEFSVSMTVISNIARNKTWSHIKASQEIEEFLKKRTTKNKQKYKHLIPEIVERLKNGERMVDLSNFYNIKYTTINDIKIRYL